MAFVFNNPNFLPWNILLVLQKILYPKLILKTPNELFSFTALFFPPLGRCMYKNYTLVRPTHLLTLNVYLLLILLLASMEY